MSLSAHSVHTIHSILTAHLLGEIVCKVVRHETNIRRLFSIQMVVVVYTVSGKEARVFVCITLTNVDIVS